MREKTVSKSKFKPRALEYFRQVEETGGDLIITDHGRPVIRISRVSRGQTDVLDALRGTVVKYDAPFDPVGEGDWEALQ